MAELLGCCGTFGVALHDIAPCDAEERARDAIRRVLHNEMNTSETYSASMLPKTYEDLVRIADVVIESVKIKKDMFDATNRYNANLKRIQKICETMAE